MTHAPLLPPTRRSPDIWEAIRRDYVVGVSTPVLGERYGLTARSIRRRAALDRWRRDDEPPHTHDAFRQRMDADLQAFPDLAEVGHVASEDLRSLMLLPDVEGLCRYAFRRAAECAALDGPTEAAAWLRVVRLAEMVRSRINVDAQPHSPADYLRASMIGAARGEHGPESAMSAMSPEIDVRADSGG